MAKDLNLTKPLWTRTKQFVPVQNHFGPKEGEGIGGKPYYKTRFQIFVPKFEHEVRPIVTSQMQGNFTSELVVMNCFRFSWLDILCLIVS